MTPCPHCRACCITELDKWWASASSPVCCEQCGKHAYVPASQAGGGLAGAVVVFLGVFFLALATGLNFVAAFAACSAASVFFYLWYWRRMTLTPIAWSEVKTAKKANGLMAILLILLPFLQ